MIKRLLTRLALWILDGQYVPAELLAKAREERDDLDDQLSFFKHQRSEYLGRAITAEAKLHFQEIIRKTDNSDGPSHSTIGGYKQHELPAYQMIDIRVPRKVLR